ncbi:hypothetical protein [Nocardia sp. N2S4-5]|uniref:hypothetical protein n=1 Tax=Nocardia sp. N2S4-5 TaxID=3351565 RepID=UPI0037D263AD
MADTDTTKMPGSLKIALGAVLLLVATVLTMAGVDWGRIMLICLEVIIGANGLFALFSGAFAGSVGIVLAVVIIRELTREAVLDWFDAKSDRLGRMDIGMGGTASS